MFIFPTSGWFPLQDQWIRTGKVAKPLAGYTARVGLFSGSVVIRVLAAELTHDGEAVFERHHHAKEDFFEVLSVRGWGE